MKCWEKETYLLITVYYLVATIGLISSTYVVMKSEQENSGFADKPVEFKVISECNSKGFCRWFPKVVR